jgi:hypothetical protein
MEKVWYILWPFLIYYGHLVHFMAFVNLVAIWYVFGKSGNPAPKYEPRTAFSKHTFQLAKICIFRKAAFFAFCFLCMHSFLFMTHFVPECNFQLKHGLGILMIVDYIFDLSTQ